METEPTTELTNDPNGVPHRKIDLKTGQQVAYVVLSTEERAKGYVEPVRRSYVHVGAPGPKYPLRDLDTKEQERYTKYGYIKYEEYIGGETVVGRYWTQKQLDRVGAGCQGVTTMGLAIAETYARDPKFYGGTFCVHCKEHFPVGEDGEFVWYNTSQRVGTISGTGSSSS